MKFHVGADDEFDNENRANACHPLGEGQRLRVAQQVDVRLAAAQTGEGVEGGRGRPCSHIGRVRTALDSHQSAFLAMSGTQRLARTTSPATVDMPRYAGRQLTHSELAESRCDVPCRRLSAGAVMLDSWWRNHLGLKGTPGSVA